MTTHRGEYGPAAYRIEQLSFGRDVGRGQWFKTKVSFGEIIEVTGSEEADKNGFEFKQISGEYDALCVGLGYMSLTSLDGEAKALYAVQPQVDGRTGFDLTYYRTIEAKPSAGYEEQSGWNQDQVLQIILPPPLEAVRFT